MTVTNVDIQWDPGARAKYDAMIKKIPMFHREIARQVVDKKAPVNARTRGAAQVEEADIVAAFFSEVPMSFYSLMIRLLDEAGFDYDAYDVGHQARIAAEKSLSA